MPLEHIDFKNPIHRVSEAMLRKLEFARRNVVEREFASAAEFGKRVFNDLKIGAAIPTGWANLDARELSDKPYAQLVSEFDELFRGAAVPGANARIHANNVALRVQLLRAFPDPDEALEWVIAKAASKVADFPKSAEDIERGRNPGDVLLISA